MPGGFCPSNGTGSVPTPQLLGGEREGHLRSVKVWPSSAAVLVVPSIVGRGALGLRGAPGEGASLCPAQLSGSPVQAGGHRALPRGPAARGRGHPFRGVGLDARAHRLGRRCWSPRWTCAVLEPVRWFSSGSARTDFALVSTPQLPASREEVRDDKTTIKCETSPPSSPRSLRLDRLHKGALHTVSHEDIRDIRK